MTQIFFAGTEVGSNRTLLEGMGTKTMAMSFFGAFRRGMPKTKSWLVSERFEDGVQVIVESGARTADAAGLSKAELENLAADYQEFLVENHDRIYGFTEFDSQVLGQAWVEQQRQFFLDDPSKFWPVWHQEYGARELRTLSATFPNVAIPGAEVEAVTTLAGEVRALNRQFGTKFHGLGLAKPDNLRQIPFQTTTTLSWLGPMRNGETIIWDGTKLVRYPKKMKDQARRRYRRIITLAGFDFEKFEGDDIIEAAKIAVWSYGMLEESMSKKHPDLHIIEGGKGRSTPEVSDNSETPLMTGLMDLDLGASDNSAVEVRKNTAAEVVARDPQDMMNLPVFGYQMKQVVDYDENGHQVLREVPVVQSTGTSLRQCDTCFVASNCPAFKPQTACAFSLPVEVKTKEQLRALLNVTLEMQGSRVAFARFSEELNGGYPDPNVSQEIDRLYKMVKTLKELDSSSETLKISMERQGSGGVLSAIFGDRAQALKELPNGGLNEDQTTRIIQQQFE